MTRPPHPYDSIPELAGIATWASASRVGYGVTENVRRLQQYAWTERRLMRLLVGHLPAMPIWEVKCAMALHQWQSVEHADALRARIAEMRNPTPNLDAAPEDGCVAGLDPVLDAVERETEPHRIVERVYGEVYPALAAAYREHIATTNPLVDYPTRRILAFALVDIEAAVEWGRAAIAAVRARGPGAGPAAHEGRFHPRRDERFHGRYNFEFPPHVVYAMPDVPAEERNLALLCKRALEMDVPEMMPSFMTERDAESWEFYRDYARQLWDEARHAMMGTVGLQARGIDWRAIPLNVSFALRLNLHATPLERQVMLYAIEQSLMPGETGKRFEYETAVAAGDVLSAHFHDYDWADEVLHAQIGRRMLRRDGIRGAEASAQAPAVHEKTWAALDRYRERDRQENWWPAFVRAALGRESAVADRAELGPINIFSE
jgi:hypothetical protein